MSDQELLDNIGYELARIERIDSPNDAVLLPEEPTEKAKKFITNPSFWNKILNATCSVWSKEPEEKQEKIVNDATDAIAKALPHPYNDSLLAKTIIQYLVNRGISYLSDLCEHRPASPPGV